MYCSFENNARQRTRTGNKGSADTGALLTPYYAFQGNSYDKAAQVYMKARNWSKVAEILPHITSPKIYIQYAKNREHEGKFKEAANAYEAGKDYDSVIRINLDHLKNPKEAVRIVQETQSVEGARVVAKFFQNLGDYASAIQFLVVSKCNAEAFTLAEEHNQMAQYADIIGDDATPEDYTAIAKHYESQGKPLQCGNFFFKAGDYAKALHYLIRVPPNDVDAALDIAIEAVGKAHKDSLTHQLIDYLMGEIDGVPKAARYRKSLGYILIDNRLCFVKLLLQFGLTIKSLIFGLLQI